MQTFGHFWSRSLFLLLVLGVGGGGTCCLLLSPEILFHIESFNEEVSDPCPQNIAS